MLWKDILNCIINKDLKQLTALLSKHRININNLQCDANGDTILHLAAKSNDVKMIEFILQRISPNFKRLMLKTKNLQQQLPSDFVRVWTPSIHSLFPLKVRQFVKAVLMLAAKRQDGTPYYPQTHFYRLPKDVLFLILQYAICSDIGKSKEIFKQQLNESTDNKKRKREDI
jgi:hypothetical protein